MVRFINEEFVPVSVNVRNQAEEFKRLGSRLGVQWTPTELVIDSSGVERHRVEGFLPPQDFLAQLELGLAQAEFAQSKFAEAERRYREVVTRYPETEVAPEALYWAGVARYKASGDSGALSQTANQFQERYQNSSWAKKASVWAQPAQTPASAPH